MCYDALCVVTGIESGLRGAFCNTTNPHAMDFIEPREVTLVEDIFQAFGELKHKPVGRDAYLCELVEELFGGIASMSPSDCEDDDAVDENDDNISDPEMRNLIY